MRSLAGYAAVLVALWIVFGFGGAPAHGSEVMYRKLDDVIVDAHFVFSATVVRVKKADTKEVLKTEYELADVTVLRGSAPAELKRAVYSEVVPIMRDAKGKAVGSFSQILSASGKERDATKGRWIFLARENRGAPLALLRIEPIDNEATVTTLIAEVEAARAKPSASASASASAAAPPTATASAAPPSPSASTSAPTPETAPAPSPGPLESQPPPARGGCAGCALAAERPSSAWPLVVLGFAALVRRRQPRSLASAA